MQVLCSSPWGPAPGRPPRGLLRGCARENPDFWFLKIELCFVTLVNQRLKSFKPHVRGVNDVI